MRKFPLKHAGKSARYGIGFRVGAELGFTPARYSIESIVLFGSQGQQNLPFPALARPRPEDFGLNPSRGDRHDECPAATS